MKTVVTGASGGFSRDAVNRLLTRMPAQDLILVTRNPAALADLTEQGVTVRSGDFDSPESLVGAFDGGERMLLVSTRDVGRRAGQHSNAIDAAKQAGVQHIVYTSSDGAEPGNPADIAPDHYQTEALLAESGLNFTIMRDSLYAEAAITKMVPAALASGQWRTAAGDGRVAFIPRAECVACAVEVLTTDGHENRTYRIANEQNWSLREVAAMAAEMFDRPIEYVDLSVEERDAELAAAGLPADYSTDLNTIAFGASARKDIVSYEHGIRDSWFVSTSRHVRTLTGTGPTHFWDALYRAKDDVLERATLHSGA